MGEVGLEFQPPLARVRLDRPDRRNAMSLAMWRALPDICTEIEARADARVVVVAGAGEHFCSGADISEFEAMFGSLEAARNYLDAIEAGLTALARLDRPVVAALEGNAIGGGLAIALCCDLRFCARDAHLAIPPAKLGLLYGPFETTRLVQLVGPARAKDLLFSGRRVPADEALALGLIDRCVAPEALHATVETYAREIADLSQVSIRGAKRCVDASMANDRAALRDLVEAAATGPEFREGRAAFKERRRPRFG